MQLTAQESELLAGIAGSNGTNIQAAILAAYEAGLTEGALRVSKHFANAALSAPAPTANAPAEHNESMSLGDLAALRRLGIDPAKKMRERNSVFTITGYNPGRWKFPISVSTQNGTRYKMTVDQVKRLQGS